MSESWIRCKSCHDVFEGPADSCPACGAPIIQKPSAAEPIEGLYADRYAGTEFAAPIEQEAPVTALPARTPKVTAILVSTGAVVLVVAMALLASSAGLFASAPTAPPILVVGTGRPSATPTLPTSIAATLQQLGDRNLCADISVQTRINVDSRILGKAVTMTGSFEGSVAGGDQTVVVTTSGNTREYRLIGAVVYTRIPPSTQWSVTPTMPSYLVLQPMLGLTKPQMLAFVGVETRDGAVLNHLRTTAWWAPDVARMAMMDVSKIGLQPDTFALDLWTAANGAPVSATFSATNTATDGTRLVDIETTYTFTNVGVPQTIANPLASPSPSATASGSPTH